jgi:DNA-binding Lrp family transcriptional regulator
MSERKGNRTLDRLIEGYLDGRSIEEIAKMIGAGPKWVKKRLKSLFFNEGGAAADYVPVNRKPRSRSEMSDRMLDATELLKKHEVSAEMIDVILCGNGPDNKEPAAPEKVDSPKTNDQRVIEIKGTAATPSADMLLAWRYAKSVNGVEVFSKDLYEKMLEEELEFGAEGSEFRRLMDVGTSNMPGHIWALSSYLTYRSTHP